MLPSGREDGAAPGLLLQVLVAHHQPPAAQADLRHPGGERRPLQWFNKSIPILTTSFY